jgi:uncharacterized protein YndB with AHSA1/START domain
MNKAKFVYVTYIAARHEQVWKALLEGEFTRKYWEHDNVSDWKPGSKWEHRRSDATQKVDILGEVVESNPPHRLVLTWARPNDTSKSRVTLDLETIDSMVRLTVTHEELEAGSDMLRGISEGWPRVCCSLKSLLETGRALPTWAKATA